MKRLLVHDPKPQKISDQVFWDFSLLLFDHHSICYVFYPMLVVKRLVISHWEMSLYLQDQIEAGPVCGGREGHV